MTDDGGRTDPSGDSGQPPTSPPTVGPAVWPQPFPVSAPAPATPASWAPAPVPSPAAPAPTYPPAGAYPPVGGAPATAYGPAGMQASPPAPKVKQAAPWAVGVPAPRPPVATPPPAAGPYGSGYAGPRSVALPQAPSPVRPGRGGAGRWALIALALVLIAGLTGGGTRYFLRPKPAQPKQSTQFGAASAHSPQRQAGSSLPGGASVSSAPSGAAVPTAGTPAAPTAMTESQALAQLQTLRTNSLPRLVTDNRWVAQVASKSVGITDPLQTTANGSHTFYAVDILAESQAVLQKAPASAVLVVQSIDFGKRSYAGDGPPYWITVVDEGFASSDQVKAWCAQAYASLTPEQLADTCAARTLSPLHD